MATSPGGQEEGEESVSEGNFRLTTVVQILIEHLYIVTMVHNRYRDSLTVYKCSDTSRVVGINVNFEF